MLLDVGPDFLFAPVGERVEFLQLVAVVEAAHRQAVTRCRLLGAHAGDPSLLARERTLQWFDLAHETAALPEFDRFVESVDAFFADEGLKQLVARRINFQLQPIVLLHLGHQVVGFQRQAAGVERENFDVELALHNQVGQHHILGAEAVGEGDRREIAGDFGEQGRGLFRFFGGRGDQRVVEVDVDRHVITQRGGGRGVGSGRRPPDTAS